MKNIEKIVFRTLVLVGLQIGVIGCLVGPDGRGGRGGRGGVWFHDGSWMDGGRGGSGHADIHPPGFRR